MNTFKRASEPDDSTAPTKRTKHETSSVVLWIPLGYNPDFMLSFRCTEKEWCWQELILPGTARVDYVYQPSSSKSASVGDFLRNVSEYDETSSRVLMEIFCDAVAKLDDEIELFNLMAAVNDSSFVQDVQNFIETCPLHELTTRYLISLSKVFVQGFDMFDFLIPLLGKGWRYFAHSTPTEAMTSFEWLPESVQELLYEHIRDAEFPFKEIKYVFKSAPMIDVPPPKKKEVWVLRYNLIDEHKETETFKTKQRLDDRLSEPHHLTSVETFKIEF